mmetsp:Transcript_48159/g.117977  ORF Transcript_48159/g.117977 Transcript_48159/m.117977 type:complete len:217 (+) Transcript_48159:44-694(+)
MRSCGAVQVVLCAAAVVAAVAAAEAAALDAAADNGCPALNYQVRQAMCAPDQPCRTFYVSNFTLLSCEYARVASYSEHDGEALRAVVRYVRIGTPLHYEWTVEQYTDVHYDPDITTRTRYVWDTDETQHLLVDTMRTDTSGSPCDEAPPGPATVYTYMSASRVAIDNATHVREDVATTLRANHNAPSASTEVRYHVRIKPDAAAAAAAAGVDVAGD